MKQIEIECKPIFAQLHRIREEVVGTWGGKVTCIYPCADIFQVPPSPNDPIYSHSVVVQCEKRLSRMFGIPKIAGSRREFDRAPNYSGSIHFSVSDKRQPS